MLPVLFSCEHATCTVPGAHEALFAECRELLTSPAGWDPGALNLAQAFAMRYRTPLIHSEVTRLLIDAEKDGESPWSEYSSDLSEFSKKHLIERHHQAYWSQLRARITTELGRNQELLHVMVHTSPSEESHVLLESSPGAILAVELAAQWKAALEHPDLTIHHSADVGPSALGAHLASKFPVERYAQLRLRVSQQFFLNSKPWRWTAIKDHLLDSLALALKPKE
ncbi:MAG TPA: N-formylglutamate amidohydrolase [Luteolibacter sp.]|nr:N-formylglutamate amidohydrolase [Luteolibacter sp.]